VVTGADHGFELTRPSRVATGTNSPPSACVRSKIGAGLLNSIRLDYARHERVNPGSGLGTKKSSRRERFSGMIVDSVSSGLPSSNRLGAAVRDHRLDSARAHRGAGRVRGAGRDRKLADMKPSKTRKMVGGPISAKSSIVVKERVGWRFRAHSDSVCGPTTGTRQHQYTFAEQTRVLRTQITLSDNPNSMLDLRHRFRRVVHVATAITCRRRACSRCSCVAFCENRPRTSRPVIFALAITGGGNDFRPRGIALFFDSPVFTTTSAPMPDHRGDGLYHGLLRGQMLMAFVSSFRNPCWSVAVPSRGRCGEQMRVVESHSCCLAPRFIVSISGYSKSEALLQPPPNRSRWKVEVL